MNDVFSRAEAELLFTVVIVGYVTSPANVSSSTSRISSTCFTERSRRKGIAEYRGRLPRHHASEFYRFTLWFSTPREQLKFRKR